MVETTCETTKAGFEEAFAKFDRSWPVVFETRTADADGKAAMN